MLKPDYYTPPTELDLLVYEKLIPADHYLRKVKAAIDFEVVREQVKDCYSPHMGRGAEDPVVMMKLRFLQYHYRLSDREVVAQAQVNVAFRFFLDLSLDSKLPTYSLLTHFTQRVGVDHFQALFENVLAQARAKDLVKDRLRLKDATHIIANIAVPSTIGLVAHCRDQLLTYADPFAPDQVAQERVKVEQIRTVTSDLKDEERLLHRVAHLQAIVIWADALQHQLGSAKLDDVARQRFDQALSIAHKLLQDHNHPQAKDRLLSPVDPDARTGFHQGFYTGYMVDVSMDADSELITAINILPANGDEAADAARLIQAEEKAFGNQIEELSMDAIGFRGDVLKTLTDPEGLNVEVFVPPREWPSKGGDYFLPQDFTFDEQTGTLTCPAGQTTKTNYRNEKNTGSRFEFLRTQCAACPLQAQCVPQLPQKKGRSVTLNDYQAAYDQARQRSQTERYDQVRQVHPHIERKLADLMGNHGGRRARYRGREKTLIQYLLSATACNIKRIVKLIHKDTDTGTGTGTGMSCCPA